MKIIFSVFVAFFFITVVPAMAQSVKVFYPDDHGKPSEEELKSIVALTLNFNGMKANAVKFLTTGEEVRKINPNEPGSSDRFDLIPGNLTSTGEFVPLQYNHELIRFYWWNTGRYIISSYSRNSINENWKGVVLYSKGDWRKILVGTKSVAQAFDLVPTSYGAEVPQIFAKEGSATKSLWALFYSGQTSLVLQLDKEINVSPCPDCTHILIETATLNTKILANSVQLSGRVFFGKVVNGRFVTSNSQTAGARNPVFRYNAVNEQMSQDFPVRITLPGEVEMSIVPKWQSGSISSNEAEVTKTGSTLKFSAVAARPLRFEVSHYTYDSYPQIFEKIMSSLSTSPSCKGSFLDP